jgi:hypothetical protein
MAFKITMVMELAAWGAEDTDIETSPEYNGGIRRLCGGCRAFVTPP